MALIDTSALKDNLIAIGQEAVKSIAFTHTEKADILMWTECMGIDFVRAQASTGAEREDFLRRVENYRVSLSTMLGVAEVRVGMAADAGKIRLLNLFVNTLAQVAAAAIA